MSESGLPPILVLQHYKENLRKCSLFHLRRHPALEFRTIKPVYPNPALAVAGGIVLSLKAPPLEHGDRERLVRTPGAQLIVVDGTWTKIRSVLENIALAPRDDSSPVAREELLVHRSLPRSTVTAYPRRSKLHEEPGEGLSSVEALVAALHILGHAALHLLDGYHWKDEFLTSNPWLRGHDSEWSYQRPVPEPVPDAGDRERVRGRGRER